MQDKSEGSQQREKTTRKLFLHLLAMNRIELYIQLPLKNLQGSCEKNTHYYNQTVINKTIHKYILKKIDQITD